MPPPRKVLHKLNFSVPDDVMRKIAQCAPGVVELVLIPLRQRLEERQRRRKQGSGSLQVLGRLPGSRDAYLGNECGEGVSGNEGLAWTWGGNRGLFGRRGDQAHRWGICVGGLSGAGTPGWQRLHGCG